MKFTTQRSFLLVTFVIISLTVFSQSATGKLQLKKGLKLQVDNTVQIFSTQELMGQSMEVSADVQNIYAIENKEKKDSFYVLASTLTRLISNSNLMGEQTNFDSDKKEDLETEMGKSIKNDLNVPKEIKVDFMGKAIDTSKADKKEEAAAAGMMDVLKGAFGADTKEGKQLNDAFEILPPNKKAGDSWVDSSVTAEGKTIRQYSIKEIKGSDAIITLTGTMATTQKMQQMGLDVTITLEGKLSGETIVDMATGIVRQKNTSMDSTGTAEIMGQTVPLTSKITSITVVKNL